MGKTPHDRQAMCLSRSATCLTKVGTSLLYPKRWDATE